MADFIVNKAGAKIFINDASKHPMLEIPILQNESENGVVHQVLSAGFIGVQRVPVVTIKQSNGEAAAYRLPQELVGWVEFATGYKLTHGVNLFPAEFEFGVLNNRTYAEML